MEYQQNLILFHISISAIKVKCSIIQFKFSNSIADELQTKLEERLLKLETENQEINQQILNIRHLYSEIKNENSSLKAQLERANESVLQAQNEMEQYKARAQRILQEKENLMSFKREDFIESNEKLSVLSNYNEEMKFVFNITCE